MSLEQIRAIRKSVQAELEFFVHGALCVCYSGQCYLSEYLTGRSANRGACAQACRSRYDLTDAAGHFLVKNKALLSLKDYNLLSRLEDLADAGICSFKIEGRLKSESYVRNVVSAYDRALNQLVSRHPEMYSRSSFGQVSGGFTPDLDKTFNRGYTELFLDGTRGNWSSMDAPSHLGEYVGVVETLAKDGIRLRSSALELSNGDGFAFICNNEVVGFRADVADGLNIKCRYPEGLKPGVKIYRNISARFQKTMDAAKTVREIAVFTDVTVDTQGITVSAVSEDGRKAVVSGKLDGEPASNRDRILALISCQLAKRSGHYHFLEPDIKASGVIPFMTAAYLNSLRRDLAASLDSQEVKAVPLAGGAVFNTPAPEHLSYKANISNSLQRSMYSSRGTAEMENAYELTHRPGTELMRSKYCVRHELGLCPRQNKANRPDPLFLLNSGKRLRLDFHCPECEMTVSDM